MRRKQMQAKEIGRFLGRRGPPLWGVDLGLGMQRKLGALETV